MRGSPAALLGRTSYKRTRLMQVATFGVVLLLIALWLRFRLRTRRIVVGDAPEYGLDVGPGSTGGSNPLAFITAQSCLRNSPFAPTNTPLLLKEPTFVPEVNLEVHYREILRVTEDLRDVPMSSYAGYSGPWIENHWVSTFCCNQPLSAFGGMVPLFVLWTDLIHARTENWFKSESGKLFLSKLRKDVIYVTVSQHDDGISPPRTNGVFQPESTWNILVLSSGGVGHIPLPLILRPLQLVPQNDPPRYLFGFAGRFHQFTNVRDRMRTAVEEEARNFGFDFRMYGGGPDWLDVMKDSKLNLAPRGYGRTSFRLTEIIQMGMLPVHIWDDEEWIPYKNTEADLRSFGFSIQIDNFRQWVRRLAHSHKKDADLLGVEARRNKLLGVRDGYYTYEGVMQQIEHFLGGSPINALSCQRHPLPVAWSAP